MANALAKASNELAQYFEPLTPQQRLFVKGVLEGLNNVAAATAAGVSNPRSKAPKIRRHPAVKEAIDAGVKLMATEALFTRAEAHEMYMDAHRNAATATEQVLAINAMVKLHGIAAPEVKEIHQHHTGTVEHREVRELTDQQLLEMAQLPSAELPDITDVEYEEIEEDA